MYNSNAKKKDSDWLFILLLFVLVLLLLNNSTESAVPLKSAENQQYDQQLDQERQDAELISRLHSMTWTEIYHLENNLRTTAILHYMLLAIVLCIQMFIVVWLLRMFLDVLRNRGGRVKGK